MIETFGAVLAGGGSTRFGSPKCLAEIDGIPLIQRVIAAQREVFSRVIILANEPALFIPFDLTIVPDLRPDEGPLGGILAALDHASPGAVCCAPCDAPFVTPALFRLLVSASAGADAVIPRSAGPLGYEPLFAWYSGSIRRSLRAYLERGGRAVHDFVDELPNVRFLAREDLEAIPGADSLFMNVNTPSDLVAASIRKERE